MMAVEESGAVRLGKILTNIRVDSGLDLRRFAALCIKEDGKPIGFSTLNKVERGNPPSGEILRAIARNPYVSKDYNLSALYQELEGGKEENPLSGRDIHTAHQIIPYADKIPDAQKRELILRLIPSLSRDSKMDILQALLDSFTQAPKGRKKIND
jgi:transcriptional regulator with XRE-family HTH domain